MVKFLEKINNFLYKNWNTLFLILCVGFVIIMVFSLIKREQYYNKIESRNINTTYVFSENLNKNTLYSTLLNEHQ